MSVFLAPMGKVDSGGGHYQDAEFKSGDLVA